jgi:hypothetical protein
MANELTYTGKGDLVIAAALNETIYENIVDRTDLSMTCRYYGSANGSGSTASKVSKVTYDDAMAAANTDEVTAVANTDLGTGAATITIARQALVRQVSDLLSIVRNGPVSVAQLGQDMVRAAQLRFTDMVCALFTGLSNSAGTSGQAFTYDDFLDALYILIRNRASGPRFAVLAPIQYTQLVESLRGEGQSIVPPDIGSTMATLGNGPGWGFHGLLAGCQVWSSDSCVTNGGDKEGAIYTMDAFGYRDGVPVNIQNSNPGSFISQTPSGSPVFVAINRAEDSALTQIVGNYFVGVSEIDDASGVKLVTSAT